MSASGQEEPLAVAAARLFQVQASIGAGAGLSGGGDVIIPEAGVFPGDGDAWFFAHSHGGNRVYRVTIALIPVCKTCGQPVEPWNSSSTRWRHSLPLARVSCGHRWPGAVAEPEQQEPQ